MLLKSMTVFALAALWMIEPAAPVMAQEAQPAVTGDATAGERVFLRCRACHQVGEKARNLVGPTLNGVIGRPAAMAEGYTYSKPMKESGIIWDEATLTEYLRDPSGRVPGTRMTLPGGLKKDKDIQDIIAYLKKFQGEESPLK